MACGEKCRKWINRGLLVGGITLLLSGAGLLARIPLTYLEADLGQAILRHTDFSGGLGEHRNVALPASSAVTSGVSRSSGQTKSVNKLSGLLQPVVWHVRGQALYPPAAPLSPQPSTGSLIGSVSIPSLHLNAQIVQGSSLTVLAEAIGHLDTSSLPGQPGTCVIAGHDVTFFHHINQLQPGDTLTITTAQGRFTYQVTSHQVVHLGQNVTDTPYPSLLLETCYPLNALTLVNQRFWVHAVLTRSTLQ